jgi:hypothetical protein
VGDPSLRDRSDPHAAAPGKPKEGKQMVKATKEYWERLAEGRKQAILMFRDKHGRFPMDALELARDFGWTFEVSMLTATDDYFADQPSSSAAIQWCKTEGRLFKWGLEKAWAVI